MRKQALGRLSMGADHKQKREEEKEQQPDDQNQSKWWWQQRNNVPEGVANFSIGNVDIGVVSTSKLHSSGWRSHLWRGELSLSSKVQTTNCHDWGSPSTFEIIKFPKTFYQSFLQCGFWLVHLLMLTSLLFHLSSLFMSHFYSFTISIFHPFPQRRTQWVISTILISVCCTNL